jgi:hypothetical protein
MEASRMSNHTPGPWHIAEAVESKRECSMRRIRSAKEGMEHGAVCEVYGIRDNTTASANASLITAAPDLLTAGEAMLEAYAIYHQMRTSDFESGDIEEGANEEYRAYNLMRMAVAKAKGKA